jgi:branched-chain amino acid transport system substrate-binding protein
MRARVWAAALLLAAAAMGCGGDLPEKGHIEAGASTPLRIGVVTTLTGPLAHEGEGIAAAVRLAVEGAGTIRGHPVAVEVVDGGCDPAAAERAVARFADDPSLIGIIGPLCSPACVAAAVVLGTRATLLISPRCTDVAVTRQGFGGVYRTAWTDAVEAVGAVDFARDELRAERVFLVNDGTLYGRSLRDVFKLFFGTSHLAGNEEALTGSEDYGPVVRAIRKSTADAVYYAGFAEDAARFVRQLRDAGVTLPVIAPEPVRDAERFIAAAGDAAEGVYVTEPLPERPAAYMFFTAAYRARLGGAPPPYAAEAYDAAVVLLRAARLRATGDGRRVTIDRRSLIDAVARTDIQGVTGRIRFYPNGDRIDGTAVRVLRVQDGQFVQHTVIRFKELR